MHVFAITPFIFIFLAENQMMSKLLEHPFWQEVTTFCSNFVNSKEQGMWRHIREIVSSELNLKFIYNGVDVQAYSVCTTN